MLAGSSLPTDLNLVGVKTLGAVLSALKRSHRFIVLDVPPMLYETTAYALTHATAVVLVANLFDLMTLNDTRKLYDLLTREYLPDERIHLVLNRVTRSNRLPAEEIEEAMGRPATARIPNAAGLVVGAANEGRPFVMSHREAPVSRSIRELGDRVIQIGHNKAGMASGSRFGGLAQAASR
jgi:pilus assembly protein CpaE